MGKLIIFSAPSGSGKTTIVRELLRRIPQLEFSISATSRAPRGTERDGVDYYFLSPDEFRRRIAAGEFVEWEEVYRDNYYGTLKSELTRIWGKGHAVILDVDVVGGMNIKKMYPENTLAIFVMPPSIDELRRRLESRGTDASDKIDIRIAKAEREISYSKDFDCIIVNDDLEKAVREAEAAVRAFLER